MDRDIEGRPTADYLWSVKTIVPILKVDKGLVAEQDGAQLMRPIPLARQRLSHNHGVIASFSRALTEGLAVRQSDHDFDTTPDAAITEIASASTT